jgi:hypothetical protein
MPSVLNYILDLSQHPFIYLETVVHSSHGTSVVKHQDFASKAQAKLDEIVGIALQSLERLESINGAG